MAATLIAYMQDQGISQIALAQRTKLGKSVINNYVKGRNGASPQNLKLIAEALGVRPEQLLLPYVGQQGMPMLPAGLVQSSQRVEEPTQEYSVLGRYPVADQHLVELPFVPYSAYGSFVSGCQDRSYGAEDFERRRITRIAGKDYTNAYLIEIRGNSMAPRYPHGARYVVRPVSDGNFQYATGVHAISLRNEMFIIKRISSNQAGTLRLTSDNTGAEMSIELGEINCMWKVGEADYVPEED